MYIVTRFYLKPDKTKEQEIALGQFGLKTKWKIMWVLNIRN